MRSTIASRTARLHCFIADTHKSPRPKPCTVAAARVPRQFPEVLIRGESFFEYSAIKRARARRSASHPSRYALAPRPTVPCREDAGIDTACLIPPEVSPRRTGQCFLRPLLPQRESEVGLGETFAFGLNVRCSGEFAEAKAR